ncbi:MAG: glucokinase [Cyanothece sp. SIO1E1]|nr:glucokinase [Cyanothece sp. SIO1E1]
MQTLLAGDIGGTKTILRLVKADTAQSAPILAVQPPLYEEVYASQDFPDLVPIVQKFLQAAADRLGAMPTPKTACFGIAGPVIGNTSELTNLNWSLSATRLEQALAIAQVSLINDFAAIGYGILGLSEQDLVTLQPAPSQPQAPIAVIGAGTGLGEGFLIPQQDQYQVFASEGSHADFAPRSALEFQLLQFLLEHKGIDRVSVERVVSGMGIVSIYEFLRQYATTPASPDLAAAFETWQQATSQGSTQIDLAAIISQAALNHQDPLCEKAMQIFVAAYGAEAGNLALKILPYGGLYIAGGIAAKILPLMQQGDFIRAFSQKGRVSPLLAQIPIHVVLNPKVGLIGAALHAAQLLPKAS